MENINLMLVQALKKQKLSRLSQIISGVFDIIVIKLYERMRMNLKKSLSKLRLGFSNHGGKVPNMYWYQKTLKIKCI